MQTTSSPIAHSLAHLTAAQMVKEYDLACPDFDSLASEEIERKKDQADRELHAEIKSIFEEYVGGGLEE